MIFTRMMSAPACAAQGASGLFHVWVADRKDCWREEVVASQLAQSYPGRRLWIPRFQDVGSEIQAAQEAGACSSHYGTHAVRVPSILGGAEVFVDAMDSGAGWMAALGRSAQSLRLAFSSPPR